MGSTLNISLIDELRAHIDQNCGNGTFFSTPSEFARDLLRQKKLRQDAAEVRAGILEGYQDAADGRTTEFQGDLQNMLIKNEIVT